MTNVLGIASYRFLPAITGGQKGIALFYKYFSGYVQLYCASVSDMSIDAKEGDYEIIPVFSKSSLRYINPFYFFRLRRIIKEKAITHILLEHPYYGWLGYLLKKFGGVKLIVHSHNIEGLRFKSLGKWWWRILMYYEKRVYRKADMNFFITEEERIFAIQNFGLKKDSCITITYGTELQTSTTSNQKAAAKKTVCKIHDINEDIPLLLFSAAFNYMPNQKALDNILFDINPKLFSSERPYHILICGPGLPDHYEQLSGYKSKHITYAGFVDDINLYFCAADVFINPIREGGGIKTKVVEALAANCSVISYRSGAYGVPVEVTGGKLCLTDDAGEFAECVLKNMTISTSSVPEAFFKHFNWKEITKNAANAFRLCK
ncbi:MAG: glycosyltransferase family 4 protein [Bacteroidetes bacterium]|nr:glycosyltransferase family 4 protein [Bacteroidota bacterium]